MIAFIVRPVEQVSSKLLFSGLFQQRPRGVRVANRGLHIESEDLGEVEGVGAMDEGLFELPVDAELFQGGGLAAKQCGQGDRADRAGAQGGELVDQQVRVSGVGPAVASVVQPLAGDVQCQLKSTWIKL
ncbi:hypothetical protein ACFCX0_36420 [Streptomyces sp. NPDC056352]|uniref:hypothetical protein n=1 Tax=Streptomyces sp. NPDC056352 TaxID=3345791 RepID=UPI0035D9B915